jgi:O-antigen/teichoic acid export membrane protein
VINIKRKPSSVKTVLLNSSLYSLTSIIQKSIGFFLLPLYTIYLTPSDYGIIGLITSFTSVVSLFFTLSLDGAVARFYFDYRDDEEKLRKFLGTIIVFVVLNSFFVSIIIFLLRNYLITPYIKGINFYPFIFIAIITVVTAPVYNIYQRILQTKQEAATFSINSSFNFILGVTLNVLFVMIFKLGAIGILLSALFTGIFFALYSVVNLLKKKWIVLTFQKEFIVEALKYSLPLIPHLMSGTLASFASVILLNNETSTMYLGLFNVGAQFLMILETLQSSVNNAYVPWFYDLMSRVKNEHRRIIEFADFLLRANCVLSLGLALFIKEIITIMTSPSYLLAWTVVPIMLIAYQIRGIYLFYVNTLFYNKKATRFIFIATLSGNVISILLSVLLTKQLGILTPGIVLIIEKSITTAIVVFFSRKFEPVDFKLTKMITYIVILTVGIGIGLVYDIQFPNSNINLFNTFYKILVFLLISIILMKSDYQLIKVTIYNKIKKK